MFHKFFLFSLDADSLAWYSCYKKDNRHNSNSRQVQKQKCSRDPKVKTLIIGQLIDLLIKLYLFQGEIAASVKQQQLHLQKKEQTSQSFIFQRTMMQKRPHRESDSCKESAYCSKVM